MKKKKKKKKKDSYYVHSPYRNPGPYRNNHESRVHSRDDRVRILNNEKKIKI